MLGSQPLVFILCLDVTLPCYRNHSGCFVSFCQCHYDGPEIETTCCEGETIVCSILLLSITSYFCKTVRDMFRGNRVARFLNPLLLIFVKAIVSPSPLVDFTLRTNHFVQSRKVLYCVLSRFPPPVYMILPMDFR